MAGRTSFYGGIVLDGLVFHIDSAKQESYSKRGLRYMQNGSNNLFVDFADTSKNPSTLNAVGTIINGATFSNFTPYHLTPYYSTYWHNPVGNLDMILTDTRNTGIGTFYGNIEFDGVDDYVSFSATPDINTTDITVSTWFYVNKFRPSAPNGGTVSMIASRYSNTTSTNGWELAYNNNGVVWFGGREDASTYISVTASLLVKQINMGITANGGWYNAVGIKSGNQWSISVTETNSYRHIDNIAKIYKGITKHLPGYRTIQAGTGTIPFGTNTLTLGKASNSNDYYMNGRLMNLSIYNRALSLAEINQNYDSFNKRIIEVLTNCVDVTIGSQIWTRCNLSVTTYRNGDSIPQVTNPTQWTNLTTGAWCYYNNDPLTEPLYGKLYNWYAVNDPRGLAPVDYHVPTDYEWSLLTNYLGGDNVAGGKLKETGLSYWNTPNADATNESGFTGLPAGNRLTNGNYDDISYYGYWWSSTEASLILNEIGESRAYSCYLDYSNGIVLRHIPDKENGYSVRLVKGDTPPDPCPDVTIGTQIWTRCNLSVTTYRNGDSIPQVTDPTQWANLTTGAWCYYNNDPLTEPLYGKLYNWYAVNDPRGLAPVDYHIPTDNEVATLSTSLGGDSVAGGKMKEIGLSHWIAPNTAATNESGFTALPAGYRVNGGNFANIGGITRWWTSTEIDTTYAGSYDLDNTDPNLFRFPYEKNWGHSVRLVKD